MPENTPHQNDTARNGATGGSPSGNAAEGFDPRFPRAFQPGFDGGVDPAVLAAPAVGTMSPNIPGAAPGAHGLTGDQSAQASAGLHAAPFARTSEYSGPTSITHPRPPAPLSDPVLADEEDDYDEEESVEEDRGYLKNPFVLTLWVVALAIVAAGLIAFTVARDIANESNGFQNQADYMLAQLAINLIPPLITLGLATVVALLFFAALRWRKN